MADSSFYALGEGRYRELPGLPFERLAPGMRFAHRPGVTLSQQDNALETLDSYNGAMIHFDARYAAQSSWQRPLMVSTLTVPRFVGMTAKTLGLRRQLLGFDSIAMTAPVFGGDTLYAESEILACRPAGEVGVVTVQLTGFKDRDAEGRPQAQLQACAKLVFELDIYTLAGWQAVAPGPVGQPVADERFACYRDDDGMRVEQFGLFFEDARPGETFIHAPSRTFHREDMVDMARRSFDFAPQLHDPRWAQRHAGGRLQVPETMLLGAVTALTTRTFGRVSANLGWTNIKLAPVFEGETVEAESTVVDARESKSRPNEGVLTVDTRAFNEAGAEVCSYRRNLLVYKRAGDSPYAAAGY